LCSCGGTSVGNSGVSCPNSFFAKLGVRLGCTLGGVHGDRGGDGIWLRVSGTNREARDGKDVTCLGKVSAAMRGALVALAASTIHLGGRRVLGG
jgi:hypothetical protein